MTRDRRRPHDHPDFDRVKPQNADPAAAQRAMWKQQIASVETQLAGMDPNSQHAEYARLLILDYTDQMNGIPASRSFQYAQEHGLMPKLMLSFGTK